MVWLVIDEGTITGETDTKREAVVDAVGRKVPTTGVSDGIYQLPNCDVFVARENAPNLHDYISTNGSEPSEDDGEKPPSLTRSASVALKRLADAVGVKVTKAGRSGLRVHTSIPRVFKEKDKKNRHAKPLAYLARIAMVPEDQGGFGMDLQDIFTTTGFIGSPPVKGMAGHEKLTLLALVPPEHRPNN